MYDSPSSLQDVCVDYITDNIEAICEVQTEEPLKLTIKEGDVYLHAKLSEQLLTVLSNKGKLNDKMITLFDSEKTRLEKVIIQNAKLLTKRGLKWLQHHSIVDLEALGLKVTVSDLINSLSEWTIENLRSLNVTNCTFVDSSKIAIMVALSKLRSLRVLNVSYTEFNFHGLEIVVEDLRFLESLDISETRVTDISPLRKCKNRLRALLLHNLKISNLSVIYDLHQLRYLDLSRNSDYSRFHLYNLFDSSVSPLSINELLVQYHVLPHLEQLDISGCEGIEVHSLIQFIQSHPKLKFLGLLDSDACYETIFTDKSNPMYRESLVITGSANEQQVFESLRRYPKRVRCTQKSLYELFSLTQQFSESRVDAIKLVLQAMHLHPEEFPIQMAATACLYNLTKGEMGQKIHPHILRDVVHCTLTAMENFPNNLQLQKNTLLTLCSDRILQDVSFDRYRCARLVLDCLCSFDEPSMGRMSVAICSILAAKISTNETTLLGSKKHYMKKLLSIVNAKMDSSQVDITLKFTLSALWNLTDESPKTCGVFLQEGGLDLFLKVLEIFPCESTVETKVLGLINNIAEVESLRNRLMVDPFLLVLRRLLRSPSIDVAYFAAGIVAHLASAGPQAWTSEEVSRQDLLEELGLVVLNWNSPEGEMVAYRSFSPFFHLVMCYEAPQVQLWALWAIQHVCTKNAKRYCPMLYQEQGDIRIYSIASSSTTIPEVRRFCFCILELLRQEGYSRDIRPSFT